MLQKKWGKWACLVVAKTWKCFVFCRHFLQLWALSSGSGNFGCCLLRLLRRLSRSRRSRRKDRRHSCFTGAAGSGDNGMPPPPVAPPHQVDTEAISLSVNWLQDELECPTVEWYCDANPDLRFTMRWLHKQRQLLESSQIIFWLLAKIFLCVIIAVLHTYCLDVNKWNLFQAKSQTKEHPRQDTLFLIWMTHF